MFLFDYFKKLFGYADEISRKRKIPDSPSSSEIFIPVKKQCRDLEMGNLKTKLRDYRYSIEDDDSIKISTKSLYQAKYTKNLSNGINSENCEGFSSVKLGSTMKPSKKGTHTPRSSKCDGSGFDWPAKNSNLNANKSTDSGMSTLAKTSLLREKMQYGEILQNYIPARIQEINAIKFTKAKGCAKGPTELIHSEKYKPCQRQPLGKSTNILFPTSSSSWYRHTDFTDRNTVPEIKIGEHDPNRRKSTPVADVTRHETSLPLRNSNVARQSFGHKNTTANSLRDLLASKAVLKNDYISEVSKRYDARIEECQKQAEELKREKDLLAKHNRLTREAVLEEQFHRSLRLCEPVLDDTEEPEDEPLPSLTNEMLQEIKHALIPHPPNQVLVEGFGLQITRKDIHTLSGLNWLNDEVINFYMNLLIVRGNSGGNFPKVHALNTFFYPKLLSGGHSSLKRWTRKVDIFSKEMLVVPIHLGMHWCMSIVDFRDKTIRYFDSMGGSNPKCLNALKQYLQDESLDKKKQPYDMTGWKLENVKDIPQQMNGSDCGVFSCMFAEYLCANKRLTFSQEDMPYFRNKMVYEILKSKLL
ncbi:sentrin-specific protease 1 [Neodiprion pinetum]|uniref:sentrin-specific protease 1 n=1 Tax=Neodiprion pinetum TaxID=441929 RepID=UPI001EE132EA|nr:sentrin-specific protease 1-like [Neodiprion pinetum]XP_046487720.1 sentrin-specific protease 1-like [Neodiprion pinetum]XP_046487789.1 sentrin-specific protease 1-like [Neodiprion pinetum]XP_046487865.1 sentrin-specific protease 1-like [Neodiprion pinetum]